MIKAALVIQNNVCDFVGKFSKCVHLGEMGVLLEHGRSMLTGRVKLGVHETSKTLKILTNK